MRFSPENIIGKNSYPGKKSEELAEKQEKEEYAFNNTESISDYNRIKVVEGQNSVHPDNKYNNVEEEEKIVGPESRYITAEDVVDSQNTEDEIINSIDNKVEVSDDDYGVYDICKKLIESANARGDKNAIRSIELRMISFDADYKSLLSQNLPLEQESKIVNQLFKEHFGSIVRSNDQIDLVNLEDSLVKNARKNRRHSGEVIVKNNVVKTEINRMPFKPRKISSKDEPRGPRITVKKTWDKWPGTDILRKIKVK